MTAVGRLAGKGDGVMLGVSDGVGVGVGVFVGVGVRVAVGVRVGVAVAVAVSGWAVGSGVGVMILTPFIFPFAGRARAVSKILARSTMMRIVRLAHKTESAMVCRVDFCRFGGMRERVSFCNAMIVDVF